MQTIKIINPAAGKGKAIEEKKDGERCYVTQSVGDAEKFVYETCLSEPETHFIICGGDGTLNEAVNGIMKANAGDKALLSVMPLGTGNDFLRYEPKTGSPVKCDVIRYGDRYFVNVLNIGFDCDVVKKVDSYRNNPLISGSFAYICGVASTFLHKFGCKMTVDTVNADGTEDHFEDEYMLCVVSNAQFYGGGFKPTPLAELTDGLADLLIVKKMPRTRFISIIGSYKKGEHFDHEKGDVLDKYKDIMTYRKCRSVRISGIKCLCADGEIENAEETEISVVPAAINVII